MNSPAQSIRRGAAAASTVYGALLYLLGLHPDKEMKYALAYVPALLGYLVVVFDKWAWQWPGVHRLTGHPRLAGTWRVTLSPSPKSRIPVGGNRGPIRAYLTIEQSFWTLHATFRTAESSSRSTGATLTKTGGSGAAELSFLYENTPQVVHQQRNPRHAGACQLSAIGPSPQAMTGRYFTERLTAGDMDLTLVSRDTGYASFEQARAADTAPVP